MAYTGVSDVQSLIPEYVIKADGKPSTTEVTAIIAQTEAAINGVLLSQQYPTVPATGDNDVAMLRGYIAAKVAAHVLTVAYPANTVPDKVKIWNEDFTAFMSRLRLGQQRLMDQAPVVTQENEVRFTRIRVLPRISDDE